MTTPDFGFSSPCLCCVYCWLQKTVETFLWSVLNQEVFYCTNESQLHVEQKQGNIENSTFKCEAWYQQFPRLRQYSFFFGVVFHQDSYFILANECVFGDCRESSRIRSENFNYFNDALNVAKQISLLYFFQELVFSKWTFVVEKLSGQLFNVTGCLAQFSPFTFLHFNNSEAFFAWNFSQFIDLFFLTTTLNLFFSEKWTYFLTSSKLAVAAHLCKHSVAMRAKSINTKAVNFFLCLLFRSTRFYYLSLFFENSTSSYFQSYGSCSVSLWTYFYLDGDHNAYGDRWPKLDTSNRDIFG